MIGVRDCHGGDGQPTKIGEGDEKETISSRRRATGLNRMTALDDSVAYAFALSQDLVVVMLNGVEE